jgi:transcriptional regulator with XRE-family HTH domain
MSQLDLALAARVSTRHLSFIETGRSAPSREMVLLLAGVLDVPLRQRNSLLESAGYAAAFGEAALDAPAMAKVRKVLDYILNASEPNPTFVLDRYQNIATANRGMTRFVDTVLGEIPPWHRAQPNYLRLVFHPGGLRRFIVNWEEVATASLNRIHREAGAIGPDGRMQELLDELLAYPDVPSRWGCPDLRSEPAVVIPMHVARDGFDVSLFSTVTTVGAPRDITVQELRIECFIPADDASERMVEALQTGEYRSSGRGRRPDRKHTGGGSDGRRSGRAPRDSG